MPEAQTPPANGATGEPTEKPEGTPPATPPAAGAATPPEKTFTQAEVDRLIEERALRETRSKFGDYDEVKRKAEEFDKLEAANQTELEKANAKAEKAAQAAKEAAERADRILVKAAIMAEASSQNAADTDTVLALLAGSPDIVIEGDEVKGAKAAVAKLLKDKPFLVKGKVPGASGGEFGGNDQATLAERIKDAESKKDWATARRLKLAQLGRA